MKGTLEDHDAGYGRLLGRGPGAVATRWFLGRLAVR